ncbi:hypothetical protein GGI12_003403 [Dipsacomyces acuminosporus]|nr:hypothetical protein GGI12_003403 [Dipsacomyces acuminosporus]
MRFFAYAPALALASIAAAAPVAQVSESASDLAPVKLQLNATENKPAAPNALNEQNPSGVDNANQDQGIFSDLFSIGKDIFTSILGSKGGSSQATTQANRAPVTGSAAKNTPPKNSPPKNTPPKNAPSAPKAASKGGAPKAAKAK